MEKKVYSAPVFELVSNELSQAVLASSNPVFTGSIKSLGASLGSW